MTFPVREDRSPPEPLHAVAATLLRAVPPLWRRLPRRLRTHSRRIAPVNRALMALGGGPLVVADMRAGHRLIVDLRSGTEWFTYYTGEFDDRRIRVARAVVRRRPGVAVDAGANIGLWTVPLALEAAAAGSRVVAAEPVPANALRLAENLRLNGVEAHADIRRVALSDAPGRVTLTLREDFAAGAMTGNAAVLIDDGSDAQWDHLEVPAQPLDEVLDDLGRPSVSVIKSDLEGSEDRFLAGADRTFRSDRPVALAEWNAVYYDRRETRPTETTAPLLRDWDYRCLRRDAREWTVDHLFRSNRPLDNVLLVPAERVEEMIGLLRQTDREPL
ncbi:FkbM family methyltransferase [Geodermatophilus ruber]|uniref:Methyltransferase, FkbM family n=1 Tax=Geodermatophilus ruber TaxID=504800 RepID=A0A1I4IUI6_9ACTN|nr:FkbM family methyltransferase [Geodermatophilus ruber]SFL57975.1 methyltransferase, FkbM family [Geodermatophilus ruber]